MGRPLPVMSHDDFLDYCVWEAVSAKVMEEEREAQKKAEREQWKKRPPGSGLDG